MAASGLPLAVRNFRDDKKMLNGMLIDLRRSKPVKARIIAADFFAHVLCLEKGEVYNKHITKILVNGRLVRKLVRCLAMSEEDIHLKRNAATALSNLLQYGDEHDKHIVVELGGRTALIQELQPKADRELRASAVIAALANIRDCKNCCRSLRESDLIDRLPAVLLDELNLTNIDGNTMGRLKAIAELIEILIDASPASAACVFAHVRLRKEIVQRITFDKNDDMRIVLRGVLVKSVLWCQKRELLQDDGMVEALDKLKSIDTLNEAQLAEVEQATGTVVKASKK